VGVSLTVPWPVNATEHDKFTVPVNPPAGAMVIVVVPEPPGDATLSEFGLKVTVNGNTVAKLKLAFTVCAGDPESLTLNTKIVLFTTSVGVPLTMPDELSAKPLGSVPEKSVHE